MIIFLYGEDSYRSKQKLRALKDKFKKDVDEDGNSTSVLDGENTSIEKINETVGSASLFARKRMIVIERVFSNKSKTFLEDLYKFLESKEKDTENIIIIWDDTNGKKFARNKLFKYLLKQKFSQQFNFLSVLELGNWIRNEIKNKGASIEAGAVNALVNMFGNDLWTLSNELNILVNYRSALSKEAKEDVVIRTDDVKSLEGAKIDENIFALTDAISQNNKALALKLFENELETGTADVYLIHMIIRQFRILLQVRQGMDLGLQAPDIAKQIKLHPFVVKKSYEQVRKYDIDLLKSIFHKLVEVDRGIKTGASDFKTQISLLVANL